MVVVVVGCLVAACGEDEDGEPGADGGVGAGEFALSVTLPPSLLRAGGTTEVEVLVERGDDFTAEVEVAVEDLPSGAQASPISIPAGETRGVIAIQTAADAPLETVAVASVVGRAGHHEDRVELELQVVGASGTLDTTFGEGGVAAVPPAAEGNASGLLPQADGTILVASVVNEELGTFALTRYLADGTVDEDYGAEGFVTFGPDDLGISLIEFANVAQQSGRVVVAGHDYTEGGSDSDLYLARITAGGELDPSFAGGGHVIYPLGDRDTFGWSFHLLAIDDDDRILVGGTHRFRDPDFQTDAMVVRFTADGELDTSFGDGGVAVFEAPGQQETAVVVAAGGRILLVGEGSGRPFAIELDEAGEPVPAFGGDGYLLLPTPDGAGATAMSGTTTVDGSILVAGVTSDRPAIWRIDPSGALDLAWGQDGVLVHAIDDAVYHALAPSTETGFLAGGSVAPGGSLLSAASSDGAMDPTFGDDGWAANDHFAEVNEKIVALAERPGFRCLALVLGGHVELVRYWR